MLFHELLRTLNAIRERFMTSLERLDELPSFALLQNTSDDLRESYFNLKSEVPQKLSQAFESRFVIAIVGSSGHGKTTILNEIFPHLAKRGWLVTDVTDTTSQSLRIAYAPPASDSIDKVEVHSWDIDRIKSLFSADEVKLQNEKDQIQVLYHEDSIEVDGTNALFQKKDLKQFKFPLKQTLTPFPHSYPVPAARLNDAEFIRALTIKEQSSKLKADPVLRIDHTEYNSLQLRAVVKNISLYDGFETIKGWLRLSEEELGNLVFVDTPGIAVSGSIKDEVLRHPLEIKSNQVVLDLLENDELDILVHMVLCGGQSDFAILWKALEKSGKISMDHLCERLIVAVNGANLYFENDDLARHVKEGDHFQVTLEENILQKMSPRGRVQPACICFLDSKRHVEGSGFFSSKNYEKVYAQYKTEMEKWMDEDSPARRHLIHCRLLETFAKNIEALKDASDRGQGFLIQQIVVLIERNGPVLLIKKNLIRTTLLSLCDRLLQLLTRYYSDNGEVNCYATQRAVQEVFQGFAEDPLETIGNFCEDYIDGQIDACIRRCENQTNWIERSFLSCCSLLTDELLKTAKPPDDVAQIVRNYLDQQMARWARTWGYAAARLSPPSANNGRSRFLLHHSLQTHMREILYQLATSQTSLSDMQSFQQTEEDREIMQTILTDLKEAVRDGESLCTQYGVAP
jgi:hypothetical protein